MREKRRERPRRCVGAPLYSGICACRSSIRFFSVGQKNFLRQRRCCAILLRRFVLGRGRRYAERCPSWPKEHDWKSCNALKVFEGSNPLLSAKKRKCPLGRFLFLQYTMGFEPEMGANTEHSEVRSDRKTVRWTVLTFLQRSLRLRQNPLLCATR